MIINIRIHDVEEDENIPKRKVRTVQTKNPLPKDYRNKDT